MSSSSDANAPAVAKDAKLMVAIGHDEVKQLKGLVNKEDSEIVVVVMAKQSVSTEKPQQENMDPHLLALASSGSYEELESLLNRKDGQASDDCTNGATGDIEAKKSLLTVVTAEGDTVLHVVATYGDGENFLKSACIIYEKEKELLFAQNKNGDTPLHCAARAGKSEMVSCLIELANSEKRVKELLRKENKHREKDLHKETEPKEKVMHKETALHEAVRTGNIDIVKQLMKEDPELAGIPEEGASPLYLAILLNRDSIVDTLYDMSGGNLSYSGKNGQNALHAAVLRGPGLTKTLLNWNKDLATQKDKNGSTPLHFAAALPRQFGRTSVCGQVLEAHADALYQPDHDGMFPIHVAASVGAFLNVKMFVQKCPSSAGLRDAKGRTFLHVAVDKSQVNVVRQACRTLSLSWIMNMRDNDGNTAVHLAVNIGSLQMLCDLLGNRQVNLNLPNSKGETPLDIAQYKLPGGVLYNYLKSEVQIYHELNFLGAVNGICRQDHFKENKTLRVKDDETKEMKVLKDSTGTLCIGSVLIASVTFGATFAVPGGYIADDHNNGGTPIFARRYSFNGFIVSNTLAFIFSAMATAALMCSGSPLYNRGSRKVYLGIAFTLVRFSITSLAAAFALGAYVVLAPVAHKTAVATCALSSLVLMFRTLEFIGRQLLLLLPLLCRRKGLIWAIPAFALNIVCNLLFEYWNLIFIFGWAAYASPAPKM